jgi:hypothetical protein
MVGSLAIGGKRVAFGKQTSITNTSAIGVYTRTRYSVVTNDGPLPNPMYTRC